MKKTMAVLCLSVFAMIFVQSCKSQKDSAKEMTREEKLETMEVSKVEAKMSINKEKLQSLSLEKTRQELLGTWNWYKTDCCARLPKTTMAKDVKESKSLYFSEDNILTYFENGEATSTVPFKVGNAFNDNRTTLKSGEFKTAIMHIKGDTLVLDYGYMDLAIDYYIKANKQ